MADSLKQSEWWKQDYEIWGDVSERREKTELKRFIAHNIDNGASYLRLLSVGPQYSLHRNQHRL